MSIALFLGRFQPFHNGHMEVVRKILEEHSFVKIAIGSSQYSNTKENPFSAEERTDMIHAALEADGITQFETVFVPDIHDKFAYAEHVKDRVGMFDAVYACESNLTKNLFKEAGYDTEIMKRIDDISSTEIRELMKQSGNEWKSLVPEAVVAVLEDINYLKIVKDAR